MFTFATDWHQALAAGAVRSSRRSSAYRPDAQQKLDVDMPAELKTSSAVAEQIVAEARLPQRVPVGRRSARSAGHAATSASPWRSPIGSEGARAHFVTTTHSRGRVGEAIELILKARGSVGQLIQKNTRIKGEGIGIESSIRS